MDRGRRLRRWLPLALMAAVAASAVTAGSLRLVVTECALGGLAAPLRVLVLSDFHAPRFTFTLARYRHLAAQARPDLVLILGDSIDIAGAEERVVELYGALSAPLGKFAILGNHEHWHGIDLAALARAYERAGVRLLVNERVTLRHAGGPLLLYGLDDGSRRWAPELVTPGAKATLALAHRPASAAALAARLGPHGMALSGHTHGGQVALFGWAPHTPPGSGSFVRGWYEVAGRPLFVTPGLGNVGLNLRLGVRPTMVALVLQ